MGGNEPYFAGRGRGPGYRSHPQGQSLAGMKILLLIAIGLLGSLASGSESRGQPSALQISDRPLVFAGATLRGKVIVSSPYEPPLPLKVFKSRSFCGANVPNETLMIGAGGGVANAVITLTPVDRIVAGSPGRAILDNRQCAFVPHVQVVVRGSDLLLKNSDPILHTVHARLGRETLFNVGLPIWRQVTKRLDRPGVIRIDCDVLHTWMSAAIVVVTTPYYRITDVNGNFILDGLPHGTYDMEVWHERLGNKKARIDLQENGVAAVEVFFSSPAARPR